MKELLIIFQFILSQETYITDEGKITNNIKGRLSYDEKMLHLVVDGQIEDYYVSHIEKHQDFHLVLFDNEGIYGTLRATKYNLYLDFTVIDEEGEMDWIKVVYKVKKTNLNDSSIPGKGTR